MTAPTLTPPDAPGNHPHTPDTEPAPTTLGPPPAQPTTLRKERTQ
ncbi:hypothetical protein ACWDBW_03970 [Streptomyces sp. NPDC001107]